MLHMATLRHRGEMGQCGLGQKGDRRVNAEQEKGERWVNMDQDKKGEMGQRTHTHAD